MKVAKRILTGTLLLIFVAVVAVLCYVVFIMANYARTGDAPLPVRGTGSSPSIQVGQQYHALSWNIGFGAYDQEYSFFMDESILRRDVEGVGSAGDNIVGVSSTSKDEENAQRLTDGVIETLDRISTSLALSATDNRPDSNSGAPSNGESAAADNAAPGTDSAAPSTDNAAQVGGNPAAPSANNATSTDTKTPAVISNGLDLVLLQEIDVDSHRSFRINQVDQVSRARAEHNPFTVYASNFHSVWLHYPIFNPIGDIQSGILTASRFRVESGSRYGYTIDESFPTKFFDLDRCFSVTVLPVEGTAAKLVLINSHMTAYSTGNNIREQQLKELMAYAQRQYENGHYVIIGGDFNQVISSDPQRGIVNWQNAEEVPTWVGIFDVKLLGKDFSVVYADNEFETATCRDSSFPYYPGENYEVIVDGFIVSSNVTAAAVNLQEEYMYSDHNPVLLTFELN